MPLNKAVVLAGMMSMLCAAQGQRNMRRAQIVGNGNSDRGKCTIEVVVDGAAEVEIRGDSGVLRDLSGQAPQWRRFECTGPLPANPADFRFAGVDGRGRQTLVSDPRNGGVAVIRIEDPQGGAEGYTFDLIWSGGSGYNNRPGIGAGGGGGDRRYGGEGRQFSDEAVRACQDAVRQQAGQRFNTSNITFPRVAVQDNPGRRDSITGTFTMRRGNYGRDEVHQFSCTVNLESGRVGAVQIDSAEGGYAPGGPAGYNRNGRSSRETPQECERALQQRLRRDGYESVEVESMHAGDRGDRGGQGDTFTGSVRAVRGNGFDSFDFSCRMNLDNGTVRSVDVRRR